MKFKFVKGEPHTEESIIATFEKEWVAYLDGVKRFDTFINVDLRSKITLGRVDQLVGFVCSEGIVNKEFKKLRLIGAFSDIFDDPPRIGIYRGLNVWISKSVPESIGLVLVINRVTKTETYFKFKIIEPQ